MVQINLDEVCRIVKDVSDDHLALSNLSRSQHTKVDGSIVTSVDLGIQASISERLQNSWPNIRLLGEEMTHVQQSALLLNLDEPCWVLDPLDGTTNFVAGFPFYGVSLALVLDGFVTMGIIYDPVRNEIFAAKRNSGVFVNGKPLTQNPSPNRLSACVANVDYKRLTESLSNRLIRNPPYRSQRNLGSCVLEWCWLAAGRFQLYLHGGEKLWDYAAGSLILEEAGGVSRTFDDEVVNCLTLRKKPIVAACTPELFEKWSEWVFSQNSSLSTYKK